MEAPRPTDELSRVAALRSLGVLDTPAEERFDRITRTARRAADPDYGRRVEEAVRFARSGAAVMV